MKHLSKINNFEFNDLLIPSIDHQEAEDDDCGLSENPIFSNYPKYLWQGHSVNGRMRRNTRLPENTDGHNHLK